ncbi:hydrogen peroxide-inducible protein activator [Flavobacteriaceae bacterium UJ101]|nr:hydrogen peroxide-inducible protein activator [Flavobacteriaceae bacterium UJ101]
MTIVQLQYVLAVHKYKNFTAAAENCFVTQPTLSMQIQKLEDELNIEIFDRSAHPIKATKIGLQIIEQAKFIVNESKKIKSIVQEEKGTLEGEFTIGVIPTVFPNLIPLFLKSYLKKYPLIKLVIKELPTNEILRQIREGMIDIGIAATPLEEEGMVEVPLYYEPFVAFIPENHKLMQKSILTRKDLEGSDLLLLEEGHCFRNNILNICDIENDMDKKVTFESGSLDALVNLARDGFGMTLLPLLQAEEIEKTEKSRLRYFLEPVPTREVSLIFHKSMLRMNFVNSLKDTVQSIIRGKLSLESKNTVVSPKLQLKK